MWLFGMYIPQSSNRDHQEGQRSCSQKTEPHNTIYHLHTYLTYCTVYIFLDTDISLIIWLFFSKMGICVRTDPIPTSTEKADRIPRRAPFTEAEWSERQEYRCRNVKRWPPGTTWCPPKKKKLPKQQHVAGRSLSMDWTNSHGRIVYESL